MSYGTNGLSFNTLRGGNVERLKDPKYAKCETWNNAQWFQAIVGELGEYANLMKKVERGDYDNLTTDQFQKVTDDLGRELADVVVYIDILAHKLGIDLGQATMDKFNEVSDRIGSRVWLDAGDWHLLPRVK